MYANTIELFKDLTEFEFNSEYYDFHNEYSCLNINFNDNVLMILFEKDTKDFLITLKFEEVIVNKIVFFDSLDVHNFRTIDSLYRGRFEINGKLRDELDGKAYFYFELYGGQKMEFWCKKISLEKGQGN